MKKLEILLREMGEKNHGHGFGEAFIHQMIETIEFVLGTVSNTASYLRLWALSLAHSQLAEVFMDLDFMGAGFKLVYRNKSIAGTLAMGIIWWPVLWGITFGFLMCVDLMECAMHCVRLHWVEF